MASVAVSEAPSCISRLRVRTPHHISRDCRSTVFADLWHDFRPGDQRTGGGGGRQSAGWPFRLEKPARQPALVFSRRLPQRDGYYKSAPARRKYIARSLGRGL